jgi:hypothetical protein
MSLHSSTLSLDALWLAQPRFVVNARPSNGIFSPSQKKKV